MASVTVFVDDAVRGTLPHVCARDGVPTGDALRRNQEVGNPAGLGVAWLLLLAGPIGWIALVAIALSRGGRPEQLSVHLPMSASAYARLRAARSVRDRSVLLLVAACVSGLLLAIADRTTLTQFGLVAAIVVGGVALVTCIVGSVRCDRERVGVVLDASRRWVTLSNVHPQFAAACEAHVARQPHRT
jgi:hypothetical protein